MQTHGPKRVYTPISLEFWFDKLSEDWSGTFTDSQLDEGRRIYRDGEVRELELTNKDAIVHRRIDKKDEYVVMEWNSTGLSVRSSTTDIEIAHALAVAGLHEIEELVADEISPLPEEYEAVTEAVGSSSGRGLSAGGNGHRASAPPTPARIGSSRLNGPSRPLILVFKTKTAGLSFPSVLGESRWQDPPGGLGARCPHRWQRPCLLRRACQTDRLGGLRQEGPLPL